MRKISDFALGAALLLGSILYCLLVSEPGEAVDITPLFFTVPIALTFMAGDLKRIFAVRKEQKIMQNVEIRNVYGHYEAYLGGKFICSGDTKSECADAVEEYLDAA